MAIEITPELLQGMRLGFEKCAMGGPPSFRLQAAAAARKMIPKGVSVPEHFEQFSKHYQNILSEGKLPAAVQGAAEDVVQKSTLPSKLRRDL